MRFNCPHVSIYFIHLVDMLKSGKKTRNVQTYIILFCETLHARLAVLTDYSHV